MLRHPTLDTLQTQRLRGMLKVENTVRTNIRLSLNFMSVLAAGICETTLARFWRPPLAVGWGLAPEVAWPMTASPKVQLTILSLSGRRARRLATPVRCLR